MKTIKLNTVLNSASSRKDRSMRLSLETPELTTQERAEIMELQGINLDTYFKPLDAESDGIVTIDKDVNTKSQAQRFRSILFLLWKQNGASGEFHDYYRTEYEKIINHYKSKIED